jgi:hypothetical protein
VVVVVVEEIFDDGRTAWMSDARVLELCYLPQPKCSNCRMIEIEYIKTSTAPWKKFGHG